MRVVIPTFFLLLAGAGCTDVRQPALSESDQKISIIPTGMSCKEAGLGVRHLTLTNPTEGVHDIDAKNSLTFGYYDESNTVFYFTGSTLRMTGVMVTSGARTMIWEMPDGADGWPSLQGPPDELTGEAPRPDAVTFCFDYELYVQPAPYANRAQRATWNITKTGSAAELQLGEGETAPMSYTITATPGALIPAGQYVDGPVFVENLSPFAVTVTKVRTMVGTINATVTCPTAGPFVLQPYEWVECSFMATVPTLIDRAVVGSGSVSHELRVTTREAMASFSAHNVGDIIFDRCAFITDSAAPYNDNFLGTVCREDGATSFSFATQIGPFACGKFAATNTATYTGTSNGATGNARWTVNGRVLCDPRPTGNGLADGEAGQSTEEP